MCVPAALTVPHLNSCPSNYLPKLQHKGIAPHLYCVSCCGHQDELELALHLTYRQRLVQPAQSNTSSASASKHAPHTCPNQLYRLPTRHASALQAQDRQYRINWYILRTHQLFLLTGQEQQGYILPFPLCHRWSTVKVYSRCTSCACNAILLTCQFPPAAAFWVLRVPGRCLTALHTTHANKDCWPAGWCATARNHQQPAENHNKDHTICGLPVFPSRNSMPLTRASLSGVQGTVQRKEYPAVHPPVVYS
jgi:hypothetical protein